MKRRRDEGRNGEEEREGEKEVICKLIETR